jgi:hypothetical protein
MRTLLSVLAACATLAAAPAAGAAQQQDEQAIRAVVDRLFDGMRTRDTTLMRSVFHAEARLFGHARDGSIDITSISDFIAGIARAPDGMVLDEVLHDTEVRVDGPLAAVWTYYDFFAGDRFSHCGHDAIHLLKTGTEWKIVALADSRRTTGCRQQRR